MTKQKRQFKSSNQHLIAVLLTFDKHIKIVGKYQDEFVVEFDDSEFVAKILQKHLDSELNIDFEKYKNIRDLLGEL